MMLPGFQYMVNWSTDTKTQKINANFQDLEKVYYNWGKKTKPALFLALPEQEVVLLSYFIATQER